MIQKLTKALEKPKAAELLDILNSLDGMQLLFAISQIKASLPKRGTLVTWILEDQEERIKNATKTTSTK